MKPVENLKAAALIEERWIGEHAIGLYFDDLENLFPLDLMRDAQNEICTWQEYAPTPLHALDEIAKQSGVGSVHYKDESTRFGLGSFKALGGAYAVLKFLSDRLSLETGKPVPMTDIRAGKYKLEASKITVATATDGNHGRSVAWGAQQAGCKCRIYIHAQVSKGREEAMAAFGAEVIRIEGDYDESVRLAASEAAQNDWQIISDTSYDGYLDIPRYVMAGYTVMVREIIAQMPEPPTHVIIQAGVGGLAAAITASFWVEMGQSRPKMIITESEHAACIIESMKAGRASHVKIDEETVMAGLSCGEISLIAWDILSKGACAVTTMPDDCVAPAMRYMADLQIEAGECSVPGFITLLALSKDNDAMQSLGLNEQSRVVVFGCEGATDPDLYQSILKGEK